ncbi:MAG: Gfo/Idh/MocA family protein [Bacteroidota bacterium]
MEKIRFGMIGGAPDSFIGPVHRLSALLTGRAEMVCGSFSRDYKKSLETANQYFIKDNRVYRDYQEMFEKESTLTEEERMQFVIIATPNHLHHPMATSALEHGFHVVCDKPLTTTSSDAVSLQKKTLETGKLFALTHPYSAYPMIKQARHIISSGELGKVRKVVVEYPQGWLSQPLEKRGNKQAEWRTDPEMSGKSGTLADIGVHAFQLAEHVSGEQVNEVCADLTTFIEDRRLEDDANLLLRFKNGAKGVLYASQISAGEENNIRLRVYCEKGSIDFFQHEPNSLTVRKLDEPMKVYRTGSFDFLCEPANRFTRLPAGHPEGLIEAFANIYMEFCNAIDAYNKGEDTGKFDFPGIEDGVRGMYFIDAALKSSSVNGQWIKID